MPGLTKEKRPVGSSDQFGAYAGISLSLKHETLLFWAYALLLSVLLFSNYGSQFFGQFFLWALVLLLIVTSLLIDVSHSPPTLKLSVTFSSDRILKYIRIVCSMIFCAAALYMVVLLLSLVLQPVYNFLKVEQQLYF